MNRTPFIPLLWGFLFLAPLSSFAQHLSAQTNLIAVTGGHNPTAVVDSPATGQSAGQSTAPGGGAASDDPSSAMDDQWHIGLIPYLWFPGVHGTTGVHGLNASVHASAGDLLSHFDIGLMGTVETRKNRFVLPIDMIWTVISDDKGVPLNELGVESITVRGGLFILTPKGGYRIIDTPKWKVDSLVGLRYWHLGEKVHFNPTLYQEQHTSQNWVDAVAGGQIKMILSPKVGIVIMGDAGGGQAAPDYEVAGLLGLKLKKNISLFMGWRYLDVHYRNSTNLFLYDMAQSGAVVGAAFYFK